MSAVCYSCKLSVERFVTAHRGVVGEGPSLCFTCVSQYAQCVQVATESILAVDAPRARPVTRRNARKDLQ